jgi:hypothetical protein
MTCESLKWSGVSCGSPAAWLVRVGSRASDEQAACGRHLNSACQALYGAEGRSGAVLTVRPVHPHD